MPKIFKYVIIVILILFIIYLIYGFTLEERMLMSKEIEVFIPVLAKMEDKDTHGGFHGDGEQLATFYLSDKQVKKMEKKIKQNENWRELPMTEILFNSVCRHANEEHMNIPEVKNGYWFVLDRHSKATNKYNEYGIFEENRYSNNFTVAVLDIENNILYYFELDT